MFVKSVWTHLTPVNRFNLQRGIIAKKSQTGRVGHPVQFFLRRAILVERFAEWVEQIATADLITKLKALQALKSVALQIDTFLRRWSFAY